mmetsp:Transcript_7640/g.22636  ORF Transcript_7640/g.22636 Transcript_7640/m.22636 type:complete len:230 (+) Transcript_7640:183-872(+)
MHAPALRILHEPAQHHGAVGHGRGRQGHRGHGDGHHREGRRQRRREQLARARAGVLHGAHGGRGPRPAHAARGRRAARLAALRGLRPRRVGLRRGAGLRGDARRHVRRRPRPHRPGHRVRQRVGPLARQARDQVRRRRAARDGSRRAPGRGRYRPGARPGRQYRPGPRQPDPPGAPHGGTTLFSMSGTMLSSAPVDEAALAAGFADLETKMGISIEYAALDAPAAALAA